MDKNWLSYEQNTICPFLPFFGISLRLKREVQKFLGANFELNDLKVNFVPFLPMFGISLRLKREVQKFLGANFELNDLKVNFVPFLPIFGISLRLRGPGGGGGGLHRNSLEIDFIVVSDRGE